MFVASRLPVAVPWMHLATGLAGPAWVLVHLATRDGLAARPRRRVRSVRAVTTMVGTWVLLGAMAAVTVTGVQRWVGVVRQGSVHGGPGTCSSRRCCGTCGPCAAGCVPGRLRAPRPASALERGVTVLAPGPTG